MGTHHNRAAIATAGDSATPAARLIVAELREKAESVSAALSMDVGPRLDVGALIVGPIPCIVNGGETYVFAPDGSKMWWTVSDAVHALREEFVNRLRETGANVVLVGWGDIGLRADYDALTVSAASADYPEGPH